MVILLGPFQFRISCDSVIHPALGRRLDHVTYRGFFFLRQLILLFYVGKRSQMVLVIWLNINFIINFVAKKIIMGTNLWVRKSLSSSKLSGIVSAVD